ncbi:MAG: 50S ribosomal protein L32 [Candidatus Moraniibacteriota bacterium]|jgi:large subunit ribosomal protein L32
MAVPKQRQNSSRRDRRRSHNIGKIKVATTQKCSSCGEPKLAHRVCDECGMYRGVQYKKVVKTVNA